MAAKGVRSESNEASRRALTCAGQAKHGFDRRRPRRCEQSIPLSLGRFSVRLLDHDANRLQFARQAKRRESPSHREKKGKAFCPPVLGLGSLRKAFIRLPNRRSYATNLGSTLSALSTEAWPP